MTHVKTGRPPVHQTEEARKAARVASSAQYYIRNKDRYKQYRAQPHVKKRDEPIKRRHVLQRYGLTDADYEKMLATQEGCCAICKGDARNRKYFDVDHDHITNRVRGLLCHVCNKYVGALENAKRTAAEEYLAACIEFDPK